MTTIYVLVPAISSVSDSIFCALDGYICHFPMDHPCLCFHVVSMLISYCYNLIFSVIPFFNLNLNLVWVVFLHLITPFPSHFCTGGHIHFWTCHLLMLHYGMLSWTTNYSEPPYATQKLFTLLVMKMWPLEKKKKNPTLKDMLISRNRY